MQKGHGPCDRSNRHCGCGCIIEAQPQFVRSGEQRVKQFDELRLDLRSLAFVLHQVLRDILPGDLEPLDFLVDELLEQVCEFLGFHGIQLYPKGCAVGTNSSSQDRFHAG